MRPAHDNVSPRGSSPLAALQNPAPPKEQIPMNVSRRIVLILALISMVLTLTLLPGWGADDAKMKKTTSTTPAAAKTQPGAPKAKLLDLNSATKEIKAS